MKLTEMAASKLQFPVDGFFSLFSKHDLMILEAIALIQSVAVSFKTGALRSVKLESISRRDSVVLETKVLVVEVAPVEIRSIRLTETDVVTIRLTETDVVTIRLTETEAGDVLVLGERVDRGRRLVGAGEKRPRA